MVEVNALGHRLKDCSEQASHESKIILINRLELWNELSLSRVDVGRVFLIDQLSGFLFNCELNDTLEFFAPHLLTLHIQEVLNILDRSFKADERKLEVFEFLTELSKRSFATLYL